MPQALLFLATVLFVVGIASRSFDNVSVLCALAAIVMLFAHTFAANFIVVSVLAGMAFVLVATTGVVFPVAFEPVPSIFVVFLGALAISTAGFSIGEDAPKSRKSAMAFAIVVMALAGVQW